MKGRGCIKAGDKQKGTPFYLFEMSYSLKFPIM